MSGVFLPGYAGQYQGSASPRIERKKEKNTEKRLVANWSCFFLSAQSVLKVLKSKVTLMRLSYLSPKRSVVVSLLVYL